MDSDEFEEEAGSSSIFKLSDTFPSYESFEEKVKTLEDETHAVFVVWNSKYVTTVNAGLKGPTKYKEELKYTNAMIVCKNYGEVQSKSKGIRPNQSTFKMKCPVYIHLKACRKKQVLYIDSMNLEHNHVLHPSIVKFYPENRGLDAENLEEAAKLIQLRVRPAILLDELRKQTGKAIIGQDIANARHYLQSQEREGRSESEDLLKYLEEIEEEGDIVVIGTTDDNVIEYIFIMHPSMKDSFEQFPEVIMLDSTYCTNKNKLPLLILECMNGMGAGEPVAYAFVAHETTTTISDVLMTFKENTNVVSFNKILSVVIDKSMSEVAALKEIIPHACIQLCSFHVQNWFKTATKTEPNKEEVRDLLQKMVYAKTDKQFNDLYESMMCIASDDFCEYFDDSWLQCTEAWSRNQKIVTCNLGNDTTNRVESLNQKLKMIVERSGTIKAAIQDFKILMRNKDNQMGYRRYLMCAKQRYDVTQKDPMVQQILNDCTKFAADLIRTELEWSKKPGSKLIYQTSKDSCSCYFSKNLLMPCRHIMRVRASQGCKAFLNNCKAVLCLPVYQKDLVAERWHLSYNLPSESTIVQAKETGIIVQKLPNVMKPKSKQDKFKSALQIGGELADVLSLCGTRLFELRSALLKDLLAKWKANEEVVLVSKFTLQNDADDADSNPEKEVMEVNDQIQDTSESEQNTKEIPVDNSCVGNSNAVPEDKTGSNSIGDADEETDGEVNVSETIILPTIVPRGRPKDDKKKYTVIGNLRKPPVNWTSDITLPPAIKIVGKPSGHNRTVFTYNKNSKIKHSNKKKKKQIKGMSNLSDEESDQEENEDELLEEINGNRQTINDEKDDDNEEKDDEENGDDSDKQAQTDEDTGEQLTEHEIETEVVPTEIRSLVAAVKLQKPQELQKTKEREVFLSPVCPTTNKGKSKGQAKGLESSTEPSQVSCSSVPQLFFCRDCKGDTPLQRVTCKSVKNMGREYWACTVKSEEKCSKKRGFRFWVSKTATLHDSPKSSIKRYFSPSKVPSTGKSDLGDLAGLFFSDDTEDKQLLDHVSAIDTSTMQSSEVPDTTRRCCSCSLEVGNAHLCIGIRCGKPVHAIPPCSTAVPGGEEGHGEPRLCRECARKRSHTSAPPKEKPKKAKLFPPEVRNQTATTPRKPVSSRSGRSIKKRVAYSPA